MRVQNREADMMSAIERKTVKQLREERGWTQFELAVKSGVSLSSITQIEAGKQEPRVSSAQKLAAAFGLTMNDINWIGEGGEASKKGE